MNTRIQRWSRWAGVVAAGLMGVLSGAGQAQGFPTPGPEHESLKRLEGEWVVTIKSPEGDSSGSATCKVVCGGLWLASDFHAEFGGQKFHGQGLDGYDPAKKKYLSVWVDSMSTRPLLFEGTMDKEKKLLTMRGEGPGPDGSLVKYRNETQFKDADHNTVVMYLVGEGGEETKMMTIEYARKK